LNQKNTKKSKKLWKSKEINVKQNNSQLQVSQMKEKLIHVLEEKSQKEIIFDKLQGILEEDEKLIQNLSQEVSIFLF
jgi:hypothetical protein